MTNPLSTQELAATILALREEYISRCYTRNIVVCKKCGREYRRGETNDINTVTTLHPDCRCGVGGEIRMVKK